MVVVARRGSEQEGFQPKNWISMFLAIMLVSALGYACASKEGDGVSPGGLQMWVGGVGSGEWRGYPEFRRKIWGVSGWRCFIKKVIVSIRFVTVYN